MLCSNGSRIISPSLMQRLKWLSALNPHIKKIASFGCYSNEPLALMIILKALEVKVVEIDENQLSGVKSAFERLTRIESQWFSKRVVEFIVADMKTKVEELAPEHFDLAYCEDVLYNMQNDAEALQAAIMEMVRVIKPGGWVIAVESKFGADFEKMEVDFLGAGNKILVPMPISEPKDMSPYFEAAKLRKVQLENTPAYTYCYRKQ